MNLTFRTYQEKDLERLLIVWNDILEDGVAFPGTELYEIDAFNNMLQEQSIVTCLLVDGVIAGYYTIHPNNIGRCSHVANASYLMHKDFRGKGLATALVNQSLKDAKELGFKGMQYNAVVVSNKAAIHTYVKAGFTIVGTIPKGFLLKDGTYSDMHIMYKSLL